MSASGQLRGRLRAVSRGRRHTKKAGKELRSCAIETSAPRQHLLGGAIVSMVLGDIGSDLLSCHVV
jgi:hypothetical protein